MKLRIKILICLILSLPLFASAAEPSQQLKSILVTINSIQGNFSQNVYNQRRKLIRKFRGTMAIQRPNRFRWEIQSPLKQLLVADGQRLWIYDRDLKQVSFKSLKKNGSDTPAMILTGATSGFFNNFYISTAQGWFVLTPKVKSSFQSVSLKFNGNVLSQMQLVDNFGQTSLINFSNVRVNSPLSPGLFKFSPPKGVDIIGSTN